jgi:hypothetical protein
MVGATSNGNVDRRQCVGDGVQLIRIAPVRHDRGEMGVVLPQFGLAQRRQLSDLVGGSIGATQREEHGGTEIDRDARVEPQFTGAADVGVIATHDHHGVALRSHLVIATDDLAQRRILIGMHLLVSDPERLLVTQIGGRVLDEQFENVIRLVRRTSDRPKHTDPGRRRGEHLQHTQRNRGLAGVAFR